MLQLLVHGPAVLNGAWDAQLVASDGAEPACAACAAIAAAAVAAVERVAVTAVAEAAWVVQASGCAGCACGGSGARAAAGSSPPLASAPSPSGEHRLSVGGCAVGNSDAGAAQHVASLWLPSMGGTRDGVDGGAHTPAGAPSGPTRCGSESRGSCASTASVELVAAWRSVWCGEGFEALPRDAAPVRLVVYDSWSSACSESAGGDLGAYLTPSGTTASVGDTAVGSSCERRSWRS